MVNKKMVSGSLDLDLIARFESDLTALIAGLDEEERLFCDDAYELLLGNRRSIEEKVAVINVLLPNSMRVIPLLIACSPFLRAEMSGYDLALIISTIASIPSEHCLKMLDDCEPFLLQSMSAIEIAHVIAKIVCLPPDERQEIVELSGSVLRGTFTVENILYLINMISEITVSEERREFVGLCQQVLQGDESMEAVIQTMTAVKAIPSVWRASLIQLCQEILYQQEGVNPVQVIYYLLQQLNPLNQS